MAKVYTGGGVAGLSGKMGGVTYSRTEEGIIMRARPMVFYRPTPIQREISRNLQKANLAWRELDLDQVQRWQAYAASLKTRNPQTGLLVAPKGVSVFIGLATKYQQIHPGEPIPLEPPVGRFLGDSVQVSVSGSATELVFEGDQANAPGVLTEFLIQRLSHMNNTPKARSYKSAGFMAFDAEHPEFRTEQFRGAYACAVRFVESSSGRMTEAYPIGRALVG